MPAPFAVRLATVRDAAIVARHRAEMFSAMGQLPATLYVPLVDETMAYLSSAMPAGEYVGWLAAPDGRPETVVAGAGVQRRRTLRHPLTVNGENRIAYGNQVIVLNVFTEHGWRRQGLAAVLMRHVLEWAQATGLDTLVLHASADGRVLYERMGFVPTTEMRFTGALRRA